MAEPRVKQNTSNRKYVLSYEKVSKLNQGIYKLSSLISLGLDVGFDKINLGTFYGLMYSLYDDVENLGQDFKPKLCPFSCFPLRSPDDFEPSNNTNQ
jgi:hypothetical protein